MCWIHFTEFHFTYQLILVLRCTLDVLHARRFVPRLLRLDAREVRLRLGACLPVPALWLRRKGEGERLAGKSRIFSSSEQRAGRAGRWVGGSTYLPHGARDEAEAHADGNLSAHVNLSGCDGMGEGMSTSVKRPGIVPRSHARGKKMGPPLQIPKSSDGRVCRKAPADAGSDVSAGSQTSTGRSWTLTVAEVLNGSHDACLM